MQRGFHRVGGTQDVTVNVIRRRQRIQPHFMQHLMRRFDVLFQDAVKLERLTVRQTNAAVERFLGGKLIDRQPLGRRDNPTRQAAAQHHGMARFQLLLGAFCANIAIILLVHAVKTDQQEVVAAETTGQSILKIVKNGSTQIIALFFNRSASVSLPSTTSGPGYFSVISKRLADSGAQCAAHLKIRQPFHDP